MNRIWCHSRESGNPGKPFFPVPHLSGKCYLLLLISGSFISFENVLSYSIDFPRNKSLLTQNLEINHSLILGRWRGFHEIAKFTVYYGYDFHADNTFLARHRVYRKETTIKDEFWQGKWDFDGEYLTIEGVSNSNTKETLSFRLRLTQENLLLNEQATSNDPFLPVRLNKQQQS